MGKTTSGRAGRFITDIDSCFLANNDEGAEITVGPEVGTLTLYMVVSIPHASNTNGFRDIMLLENPVYD